MNLVVRMLRRLLAAALFLCTSLALANELAPHHCPADLVASLTGQFSVARGPHAFHHPSESDADALQALIDTILKLPYGPAPIDGGALPLIGHLFARIPEPIRSTSRFALDADLEEALRLHDPRIKYLDFELSDMNDEHVQALLTHLEIIAEERFPFDFLALYTRTYEFVAHRVNSRAYRRALASLGEAAHRTVLRALQVLRLRDIVLRQERIPTGTERTWAMTLRLVQTARWEDWHRFSVPLGQLLREAIWIAATDRDPKASAQLLHWLLSPQGEAAREFLLTYLSPDPRALDLGGLLARSANYATRELKYRVAPFLLAYASRNEWRRHMEHRALLAYHYGSDFFERFGHHAQSAKFRDAAEDFLDADRARAKRVREELR